MRGPRALARGNSSDRWERGVFLGYGTEANSYLYANQTGIQSSRCLERLPLQNRWNLERITEVQATPHDKHLPSDPRVIMRESTDRVVQPSRPDSRPRVRKLKISMDDLDQYGYTEGCQQCTYILRYRCARPGYTHSDACRQHVIDELTKTPEGRERLARLEERVDRALGEFVEAHARATGEDMPRGDDGVMDPHLAPAPPIGDSGHGDFPSTGTEVPESRPGSLPPPDDASVGETQGVGAQDAMLDGSNNQDGDDPMASVVTNNRGRRQFSRPVGSPAMLSHADKVQFAGLQSNAREDSVVVEDEVVALVSALGGDAKNYRKEYKRSLNRMVSEVYSPARVTAMAKAMPSLRLIPGFALDLTTIDEYDGEPWDFTREVKRRRALKLVDEQKPMMVIGSPACKAFCSWQQLNQSKRDPVVVQRELVEAKLHIAFVAEIYKRQHRAW